LRLRLSLFYDLIIQIDPDINVVLDAAVGGRLVPFLGAGANLCDRSAEESYTKGKHLPSGTELASYLAENLSYPAAEVRCPHCDKTHKVPYTADLLRVAQYVALVAGMGPLYEKLRNVFDADYPPTALHHLLAKIPGILRSHGYPSPYQLIVTTNYDDLLERAFASAGEPFDLVTYVARDKNRGKFLHQFPAPDSGVHLIERPNEYPKLSQKTKRHYENPRSCGPQESRRRQFYHHRRPLHRLFGADRYLRAYTCATGS
jgi:hypothetical protein